MTTLANLTNVSDPMLMTLIVANIGTASVAVTSSIRAAMQKTPRSKFLPWAFCAVSLAYLILSMHWISTHAFLLIPHGIEIAWRLLELVIFILINWMMIEFCHCRQPKCQ